MLYLSHILTVAVALTIVNFVLCGIGCVVAFHQTGRTGFRDFIRYLLPRDLIRRRSCYQDVGFILLKRLMQPWLSLPFFLLTSAKCALVSYGVLVGIFGPRSQGAMSVSLFACLLIAAVLIQDFLRFYTHYLLHRVGGLWDIHKVHHSSDFLTPLTNHRVHVIEEIIQQAATGLSVGPLLGLAAFLTSTSISTNTLMGFDAYILIDTLCFSILRHSHIGLSFGRLERYLMSPKQHHLHHSIDPRHWHRNFGFLLSCWDRLAGTICYSDPKENLNFGILTNDLIDYNSVLKLHVMPYIKLYRRCRRCFERPTPIAASPPDTRSIKA